MATAFGTRVRHLREQQGLGVRALARVGNFDPGWLSQIERGLRDCGVTSVVRIADALGVPPEDLVRDLTPN